MIKIFKNEDNKGRLCKLFVCNSCSKTEDTMYEFYIGNENSCGGQKVVLCKNCMKNELKRQLDLMNLD